MERSKQWSRLDNAAKIFPPTSSKGDTKVFRFVCELTAPVDGAVLQHALEKTVEAFPLYRSILKKGLFWYYFEESGLKPRVFEEALPVCTTIYSADRPGLLYRVSYYRKRINLEVFHALADGTGALQFLRTLVFNYLAEKHGLPGGLADYDAAPDQKGQDAFYQYYDKGGAVPKRSRHRAYRIRGERLPDKHIGITEGFMPAEAVLRRARELGSTLSEFMVALLICSIYDGMAVRERAHPVVVSVPVDLRRFFPAQTARNFFGVTHISHNFQQDGETFEQVLSHVREEFAQQLTKDNLQGIISRFSAIENNLLVKAIPLLFKIPVLRIAGLLEEGGDTTAFSNVGRVVMPDWAAGHIRLFDVFLSTKRPQLCMCSFGDTLAISVSSPLVDTGLQRRFFRRLTAMGVAVRVVSNLDQTDEWEVRDASV